MADWGYLLIIEPDRADSSVRRIPQPPDAAALKRAVHGGNFRRVPMFDDIILNGELFDCRAYCDADARRLGLPSNPRAADLWRRSLARRNLTLTEDLAGAVAVVAGAPDFFAES